MARNAKPLGPIFFPHMDREVSTTDPDFPPEDRASLWERENRLSKKADCSAQPLGQLSGLMEFVPLPME
jgi:hypothetical protein